MGASIGRRFRTMGLVGPHYEGLGGKARFAWHRYVYRTEVVSVATPGTITSDSPGENVPLTLHVVTEFADLAPYRPHLDAAYHQGFTATWQAPFTWGEAVALGLAGDAPVAFTWIQRGLPDGFPCHYGPILAGEARLLRAGVLPEFRGQGMYARLNRAALRHLFRDGITRVYIDCYRANIPAFRAQMRAGFRPIGLLKVFPAVSAHPFVRWEAFPEQPPCP